MAILFRGKIFLEMSPTKRVGIAVGLPSETMFVGLHRLPFEKAGFGMVAYPLLVLAMLFCIA
jgi:hypothetical protein